MSYIRNHVIHPKCGQANTIPITKESWFCQSCREQFFARDIPQPTVEDLELGLLLNEKRREHHRYFGEKQNYLSELERIDAQQQALLERRDRLSQTYLNSPEVVEECNGHEASIRGMIKELRQQQQLLIDSKKKLPAELQAPAAKRARKSTSNIAQIKENLILNVMSKLNITRAEAEELTQF